MARKGSREDLQSGRLSRRATDPAAEAERKAAQEKMFSLDMDKVMKGVWLQTPMTFSADERGFCKLLHSQPAIHIS